MDTYEELFHSLISTLKKVSRQSSLSNERTHILNAINEWISFYDMKESQMLERMAEEITENN